jgi:peptide/nickel transport system substrate-binding protein
MKSAVLFLFFLVAPALNACGGSPSESSTDSNEAFCETALARVDSFMATFSDEGPLGDRYGGTAVVGTFAESEGMNALVAGDAGSVQHQMFVNLMTLIQYDENLMPVPYLAESWEVSPDETELTFHLRDDVYWHDGELTTAHDVAFTYRRAVDPKTGFPNSAFFQHYLPGNDGVEVVDSFTVRFRMRRHADYMDPWRAVAIMPRHLLAEVPPEELQLHPFGAVCPVGNGPFRFVSHIPQDRWVFEANPAFPAGLGGRPYLDRYVNRVIADQTTLLQELLTGGIDVYVAMVPQHAEVARGDPGLRVESFQYRSFLFVAWNSRVPKLADPRVRRALTLGTDRRRIMEGIRGSDGILANTGVPPFHFAFDPQLSDSLGYNPDEAMALLEEAGWTDGDGDGVRENSEGEPLQITLLTTTENQEWQDIAVIMQAHLGRIGVDLRPRTMEFQALIDVIMSRDRDFEAFLLSFEVEFRLEERDLFHSDAFDGPLAFSGTRDEELDRYLDTLQLSPDRSKSTPLWHAYQQRIMEVQPFTFFYWAYRLDGVNGRLRDATMDARGEWANIRNWWIDPDHRGAG